MRTRHRTWHDTPARFRWLAIPVFLWLLFQAGDLQAGWKITQVDRLSARTPYVVFGRELVAYTMNSDLYCLDPATGEKATATDNGSLLLEIPLAIEGKRVWYRSSAPENPTLYHLCLYDAETGEHRLLHTSLAEIARDPASADGGRLAVVIADDLWLWSEGGMEQITASAAEVDRDLHLSGNYLLWQKGGVVAIMTLATRSVRLLSQTGKICRHLRASTQHAVWVEEQPALPAYDRVMYHRLGSTETLELAFVCRQSDLPLSLEQERLLFVAAGTVWGLFEINLDLMELRVAYVSDLRLENPLLHGNQAFFLQYNCPEETCLELHRLDLSTAVLTQITSFGDLNFVGNYTVTAEAVTMLHLLVLPPYDPDILRAVETPNVVCGTAAAPGTARVSLNLLLLLLPVLGATVQRDRFRRGRQHTR